MVTTTKITAAPPINSLKTPNIQTKKSTEKFNAKENAKTVPTGETYQAFSVTALSSLFFDEQSNQPHKQQAFVYGNNLLDQLETIRMSLISGKLPKESLDQLMKILANRPKLEIDPELENLIREIETRAAVELAKLGA